MGIKIQNKPLYASLIALVLAIAMAMSGIGMALGAPDDGSNENLKYRIISQSSCGNDYGYVVDKSDINGSTFNASVESTGVGTCTVFEWCTIDGNNLYDTNIDLASYNMSAGDTLTINVKYSEYYDNGSPGSHLCTHTYVVQAYEDISTAPVSFTLNFKATGIQATGFTTYKEAFAALNGLTD